MEKQKSNKGLITFLVILVLILMVLVILLATETISFKSLAKGDKKASVNSKTSSQVDEDTKSSKSNTEVNTIEEPEPEEDDDDEEVPSTSKSKTQNSSVDTATILEYYKNRIFSGAIDSSNDEHKYAVEDINDDGIPELITYEGGFLDNVIIGEFSVYTYDENSGSASEHYIIPVGTIQGRYSINTLLYKMNDGTLLSLYASGGVEEASYYKLENNSLVRTKYTSRETDNYIKGDKEIKFVDCSDTSLIDNYR